MVNTSSCDKSDGVSAKSCIHVESSDFTFPFMLNIALAGFGLLWTDVGREGETTFRNV